MVLAKKSANKLRIAKRAMETAVLGITKCDRKTNEYILQQIKVTDITEKIAKLKRTTTKR